MNPELLSWLKSRGGVGLLIVALWVFRDQISFSFHFGQRQAPAHSVSAAGQRGGDTLTSPVQHANP